MVTKAETLLTIAEAAKLSPYSEPQIRDRIRDGRLDAVRIGRNIFLRSDVVDRFLSDPVAK